MGSSRVRKTVMRVLALMLVLSLLGINSSWAGQDDAAAIPDDALKQALLDAGADSDGDGVLTVGSLGCGRLLLLD